MHILILLILVGTGSVVTFFAGKKMAYQSALFFGVVTAIYTLSLVFNADPSEAYTFYQLWMSKPAVHFALEADGLSLSMLVLTACLLPIIILSSRGTSYDKPAVFYSLVLFMAMAMMGTFLATDGLLYYVFWELALIPIYFIALLWGDGAWEERKKAVFTFFVYTIAGSLFMLAAIAFLYTKAHSFAIEDWYQLHLTTTEQYAVFAAFFLAYAIKIPIIPFHSWQANVYRLAPTTGTMLLSGIMLKMGLYSVIRWQLPIAPATAICYQSLFVGLSIAGVVYGSIAALRQGHLKTLLAYSSLAHVGLIAAGCYTLTVDGLVGAVHQMIAHGFVIVGLFLAAEIIFRRALTFQIDQLGGIRQQNRVFASLFLIMVLASVAMPGTYNFVGEFTVLYSLSQVQWYWALIGGTTIILGAYYMLRMFQHVMLGPSEKVSFTVLKSSETMSLILVLGFLLFFGLYPKPITDLITPSIEKIILIINR